MSHRFLPLVAGGQCDLPSGWASKLACLLGSQLQLAKRIDSPVILILNQPANATNLRPSLPPCSRGRRAPDSKSLFSQEGFRVRAQLVTFANVFGIKSV